MDFQIVVSVYLPISFQYVAVHAAKEDSAAGSSIRSISLIQVGMSGVSMVSQPLCTYPKVTLAAQQ